MVPIMIYITNVSHKSAIMSAILKGAVVVQETITQKNILSNYRPYNKLSKLTL